ncbi:MAG: DEAD/DEAH box helicase [Candidatus Paceibacterota bacterium]
MITITIVDSVVSRINRESISLLRPAFSFQKSFWKKEGFTKKAQDYDAFLISQKGEFLTGFVPKIIQYCQEKNLEYEIENQNDWEVSGPMPFLPNVIFRDDQKEAIIQACEQKRGVILHPTGSGKTVIICGIISTLPKVRILFLCHTVDLINQTVSEFKKFGLGPISQLGGGKKDISGRIVVSTIQSFSKLKPEEYCDLFYAVIVDECHHVGTSVGKVVPQKSDSIYSKVLKTFLAPMKIGVTATLPSKEEGKFALEGLIGPVIANLTIEQATKLEILAEPKVKLIKVDYNTACKDLKRYNDLYDAQIVNNRRRNRKVIKEAKDLADKNKSSIIYVSLIEHGENLQDIAMRMGFPVTFVRGEVSGEERLRIKSDLEKKEILTVISTVVWREGVNIKSLNAIILASGGKDSKSLIQSAGRGLRRDPETEKEDALIIDFADPVRYLAEHFVERLGVFIENKWAFVYE